MLFLVIAFALAGLVWSGILLSRGSLALSCGVFLILCGCLPAEFFSFDLGGLTWTLDRLWLLALLAQAAMLWYRGERVPFRIETTDLLLGLFVLWLLARTLSQPLGTLVPGQPSTVMHLVNGYLVPLALFAVLRLAPVSPGQLKPLVACLALLGLYLAATAVFEVTRQWQFVFPKFIADPTLGIHFGRARGPMLQSVRLGMCLLLVLMCWPVFTVWLKPNSKSLWMATLVVVPALLLGIFLTYTRSIWMGAALVLGVQVCACLQGVPRKLALVGAMLVVVLGLAVKGKDLVAFKREYSAAETRESTYMRASFAYVSWKMFQDRPVAGFGFNQFQVHNRSYLSDRSTDLRLESIRGYVHHNSFLSLLVDLGLVGFALYSAVIVGFTRKAWKLWFTPSVPHWARGIGLSTLAVLGVHLIQMAFHEVSFSSLEHAMLYSLFGLTAACHYQFVAAAATHASAVGSTTPVRHRLPDEAEANPPPPTLPSPALPVSAMPVQTLPT
jgi:O-antigen ligase